MRLRRLQFALYLLLLLLSPLAAVQSALPTREAPEHAVKAAYVLLFTRYVEWPSRAFASETAPLEVLVLGADPFGATLDSTLAGVKSQGRDIVVRRAASLAPGERPHVVFFGEADESLQAQWRTELLGAPALTIAEESSAAHGEPMLTFINEIRRGETRVRFDVNFAAAQRAGLLIRSQMLASARRVVREPTAQDAGQ